MAESSKSGKGIIYPVWTALFGAIVYLVSGLLVSKILGPMNLALGGNVIIGALGGLCFGLILFRERIGKALLAGIASLPIGFLSAFIVAEGLSILLGVLVPQSMEMTASGIMNTVAIILMGVLCGAIFGLVYFGKESIYLFALASGIVGLPFGLLIDAFNKDLPIRGIIANALTFIGAPDLNMLAIVTSVGMGIGLSIGLYKSRKSGSV